MELRLGQTVKVKPKHWLRAGHTGRLVAHEPKRANPWLVEFEHGFPGGGIDGNKLYLNPDDFSLTERRRRDKQNLSLSPKA